MKLPKMTMALVTVAVVLGGVVAIMQIQDSSQSEELAEQGDRIFQFEEGQVQQFTVKTADQTLAFAKDDGGTWQMTEPEEAIADAASVAYLLNLLATGSSERTLTVPAADQSEFGLDEPLATVTATLEDDTTHTLILGDYDFNGIYLYAQADPPAESEAEVTVMLVSADFENAVTRPLEDWQQSEEDPDAETDANEETAPEEDGEGTGSIPDEPGSNEEGLEREEVEDTEGAE
jgi:hypothetical protein